MVLKSGYVSQETNPPGPAFIYRDVLKRARYAEAFLCGKPPHCSLAAYELAVIDTPTDEPTMTVAQLNISSLHLHPGRKQQPILKKCWQRLFGKSEIRSS